MSRQTASFHLSHSPCFAPPQFPLFLLCILLPPHRAFEEEDFQKQRYQLERNEFYFQRAILIVDPQWTKSNQIQLFRRCYRGRSNNHRHRRTIVRMFSINTENVAALLGIDTVLCHHCLCHLWLYRNHASWSTNLITIQK